MDRQEPELFQAFPALGKSLPWVALGAQPTPVERHGDVYIKRDDQSGRAYGGNKVRKLEFLLAQAKATGIDSVATIGAYGSHHVLATAIYCAQLGLQSRAVIFPQPMNDHVRDQLTANVAVGNELVPIRSRALIPFAALRARRGRLWIPGGGSSALGTLGHVDAAYELRRQIERGQLPAPDFIYVALGTGSTVAGLALGCALAGLDVTIRAVRVVDRIVANRWVIRRLVHGAAGLLGVPAKSARIDIIHSQFGGGYGVATDDSEVAVREWRPRGVELESTYTGKAMAALMADARAGRLSGKHALFWNTFSSVNLAPLIVSGSGRLPPHVAALVQRS